MSEPAVDKWTLCQDVIVINEATHRAMSPGERFFLRARVSIYTPRTAVRCSDVCVWRPSLADLGGWTWSDALDHRPRRSSTYTGW